MMGRGCLFSFASTVGVLTLLAVGFSPSASAETVEVAPGVQVTKKTGQPLHGPVTFKYGGTELALGHEIARQVLVEAQE